MTMKFKAGDWLAWNDTVARVSRLISIDGNDYYRLYNGGSWPVGEPSIVRVRVTFPKPKRKLTLSQGLAWLPMHVGINKNNHGYWEIRRCGEGNIVATGPTLLKAIIAARKALGVK